MANAAYVYLMEMGEFHKIGQTIDVPGRMMSLDVGPIPLRLVHSFVSDDSIRDEAYLHRRYAAKHVRREWFRLDAEDVAYVRRIERGPLDPLFRAPASPPPLVRIPARIRLKTQSLFTRRRVDLGRYVADLATYHGLTMESLSEKANIPLDKLLAIVGGRRRPSAHQAHRLEYALGLGYCSLRFFKIDGYTGLAEGTTAPVVQAW